MGKPLQVPQLADKIVAIVEDEGVSLTVLEGIKKNAGHGKSVSKVPSGNAASLEVVKLSHYAVLMCLQEFPMSSEATPVEPAVLVSIICESVLRDRVVHLLKKHSVSGYTISQVQGEGGHGRRMGDIAGYNTNVEIKAITSSEISDGILSSLKEERGDHALIAFRQEIEALY